jgi:copper chaperone CopZ
MKKTIKIEGMMCGHCTGRVETTLKELGATVIETSVEKKHAIIDVDNISDDKLKEAIEDVGYDVLSID